MSSNQLQYRYPGPQPFSTKQAALFFGRGPDIKALIQQISLSPWIVLYGKSGLGKSSLLNAGVIPAIQTAGELVPFTIRFGAWTNTEQPSPLDRTKEALQTNASPLLARIRPEGDDSLWYYLKNRQLNQETNQGFLLLFDQFEEMFTYPEAQILAFAKNLQEALHTTIPNRYRRQLEHLVADESGSLSEADLKALHQPFQLKSLAAIRSDRYALLNQLKPYLPEVTDVGYELKALEADQAEDAILSPAYAKEDFRTPRFDYSDEAVEHLLHFLSKGQSRPIESFQLQILCEYAEQQVVDKQGKNRIEIQDLADPEGILENYYLSKIAEIPESEDQLAARKLIEEGLIFEEEERRLSLYEGIIENRYGISNQLLLKLLDTHLLRAEPSLYGDSGYTYELSHDTLVAPVLRAKAKRVQIEEARAKAAAEAARERELAGERKKRRRATLLAVLGFVLAAIAIVASIIALNQTRIAKDSEQRAQEALDASVASEAKAVANLKRYKAQEFERYKMNAETFIKSEDTEYARVALDSMIQIQQEFFEDQADYQAAIRQLQEQID